MNELVADAVFHASVVGQLRRCSERQCLIIDRCLDRRGRQQHDRDDESHSSRCVRCSARAGGRSEDVVRQLSGSIARNQLVSVAQRSDAMRLSPLACCAQNRVVRAMQVSRQWHGRSQPVSARRSKRLLFVVVRCCSLRNVRACVHSREFVCVGANFPVFALRALYLSLWCVCMCVYVRGRLDE